MERIIGIDDSTFSGTDLATLIRKKYGRSYDVLLIKKVFSYLGIELNRGEIYGAKFIRLGL